ncbi:MAG: hypothetical protein FWE21_07255 [Defluviitaleaceae bacterium]|nr:hypothetical protein [Defluviitaleaceae bacterium]
MYYNFNLRLPTIENGNVLAVKYIKAKYGLTLVEFAQKFAIEQEEKILSKKENSPAVTSKLFSNTL